MLHLDKLRLSIGMIAVMYMMSTMHGTTAELIEKHPKGSKEKRPIPCPTSIVDYNKFMGGVDLADQMLTYNSLTKCRVLKLWKKNFFGIWWTLQS